MYVDSSLIISKLCDIAQHVSTPTSSSAYNHRAYEAFGREAMATSVPLIPSTNFMLNDPTFVADRQELIGPAKVFSAAAFAKARPQTLANFMALLEIIERDMLGRGERKYVLGGDAPSMADIYVHYIIDWTLNFHKGSEPEVTRDKFPGVFAWVEAVNAYLAEAPKVEEIEWAQARAVLLAPPKHEFAKFVKHDEGNVLGLKEGQEVEVIPVDTGRSHPQPGVLVSLNNEQMCIRNKSGLLMHFPRIGYTVTPVGAGS